ncbi:MAG: alpha-1,2-fucosyltransferase [Selenomonadaceae bacterium]|nr:alpha-1,2-fucosyltransferase [Selenomonadaceae bacterium]
MIIVRLSDGLGNQMFQYALAKKLALLNNTEVVFDMSWYEINKHRGRRLFQLAVFPLNCRRINEVGAIGEFWLKNVHFTRNIYRKLAKYHSKKLLGQGQFIIEQSPRFDATVVERAKDKNVYLQGYWQTEQYFADIRSDILKDFRFLPELTADNLAVAQRIEASANPVALHIRRGDYLNTNFALCSLDYYARGIQYLSDRLGKLQIFVFSNDIPWAKENLKTRQELNFVASNNEDKGYADIQLMSMCHHHIIANSSFSWWGAWLSTYANKIVVAPQQWVRDNNSEYADVVPREWVRM